MPEESELDQAAEWLERLTKDPTVRGTVTVLAINDVGARPRYQTCRIDAMIQAPGQDATEQQLEYTVRRDFWPAVGDVLPATVHLERPERTEVDWDLVADRRERRARVDASRRKAARSG
ncbi:MAG TPA: hypothetical protein VNR37_02435 [Microbacteriaceae bacterium]|nr:hypothetical protein [Microbacteriaceae bacterium]